MPRLPAHRFGLRLSRLRWISDPFRCWDINVAPDQPVRAVDRGRVRAGRLLIRGCTLMLHRGACCVCNDPDRHRRSF